MNSFEDFIEKRCLERFPEHKLKYNGELIVDSRALALHVLGELGEAALRVIELGSGYLSVAESVKRRLQAWREEGFRLHCISDADGITNRFFSHVEAPQVVDTNALCKQVNQAIKDAAKDDAGFDFSRPDSSGVESGLVVSYLCAVEYRAGNRDIYVVGQSPEWFFMDDVQYVPLKYLNESGAGRIFDVGAIAAAIGLPREEMNSLGIALVNDPSASAEALIETAKSSGFKLEDNMDEKSMMTEAVLENRRAYDHVTYGVPPGLTRGTGSNSSIGSGSPGWTQNQGYMWEFESHIPHIDTTPSINSGEDSENLLATAMKSLESPGGLLSSLKVKNNPWEDGVDPLSFDSNGINGGALLHSDSNQDSAESQIASGLGGVDSDVDQVDMDAENIAEGGKNNNEEESVDEVSIMNDGISERNSSISISSSSITNFGLRTAKTPPATPFTQNSEFLARRNLTSRSAPASPAGGLPFGAAASDLNANECAEKLAAWLKQEFGGSTKAAHLGRFYKMNPAVTRVIKSMNLGQFVELNKDILSWNPDTHVISAAGEEVKVSPEEIRKAAEAVVAWIKQRHGWQASANSLTGFYRANPRHAEVIQSMSLASFIKQNADLMIWNAKTRQITLRESSKQQAMTPPPSSSSGIMQGSVLAQWIAEQHSTEADQEEFYEANPTLAAMVVAEWLTENHGGVTNIANIGPFYRKQPVLAKIIRSKTLNAFTSEHSDILNWNSKNRLLSVVKRPQTATGAGSTQVGPEGFQAINSSIAPLPVAANVESKDNGENFSSKSPRAGLPSPLSPLDGTSDGITITDRSAAKALAYWLQKEYGGSTNAANLGEFYKIHPHISRHVKAKSLQTFVSNVPDLLQWNGKTHVLQVVKGEQTGSLATIDEDAAVPASRVSGEKMSYSAAAASGSSNVSIIHGNANATNSDSPTSQISTPAKKDESAVWSDETKKVALHLAQWLQTRHKGSAKASTLGVYYRMFPEAAKIIKARGLGEFCSDHGTLFDWQPRTHMISVKEDGFAALGGSLQDATSGPNPELSNEVYALCALRTWMLEQSGSVPVSQFVTFNKCNARAYSTITIIGLHNFAKKHPSWIAFEDANQSLVLAEVASQFQ